MEFDPRPGSVSALNGLPTQAQDARLATACERALVVGARSHGAGTRQQLRAAARRFVRRHRRDVGFLHWVLRSVGASSALALALLGLDAAPAQAQAIPFAQQFGSANPFPATGLTATKPALGDLDGDGDPELVLGLGDGRLFYLENTGSANSPSFDIPFATLIGDVGFVSAPSLGDLDRDGDLDLVSGDAYGGFAYFENTGSATSPTFVQRTGTANPLDGKTVADPSSSPSLGDLDGDGDLDLVAGDQGGDLHYFENTETATNPVFVERTGSANPTDGQGLGIDWGHSAPGLGDVDADGDLDLVAGANSTLFLPPAFHYFENTGGATSPALVARTGAANPFSVLNAPGRPGPTLRDVDADGDIDLVAGAADGTVQYFKNLTGSLVPRDGAANPLDGQDAGDSSRPAFADLDADGDRDLVAGDQSGGFAYFENTGSAASPVFVPRTGAANPLDGQSVFGGHSAPSFGDLDGDGDLDLVSGAYLGTFSYFENTGSVASPAFAPRTGSANPLDGEDVGDYSTLVLGNLDGDGDLDLVAAGAMGGFAFFENTGSAASPAFVPRTGAQNPLDGRSAGFLQAVSLGDVDGDDDLDLLAGGVQILSFVHGRFLYFENTGSPASPAFPTTGSSQLLNDQTVGGVPAPALADLDADGNLDLVSGHHSGAFYYFENTGAPISPLYSGPADEPFDGADVGGFSNPAAGDLDADGDADFVATDSFGSGVFHYFENTGPAVIERFGAANPFDGESAGWTSPPALGDVDADGDLDLVTGENYGASLRFYENTGDANDGAFYQHTGGANPFGAVVAPRSAPALGDLDADGDLDLVVGEINGTLLFFENTMDAETPVFVAQTGAANPLDGQDIGSFAVPTLGDVDRDGDLDLLVGDEPNGRFYYFENTGSATAPAFAPRTGYSNPLASQDVGLNATPTFVDVDRDGDLDVVAGDRDGTFQTFYLPEPSQGALLGAGLALLAWLRRLRERER